jgi:lipoate-protein ligase A
MNWLLLNSGKGDAAFNMALDEALLENSSKFGRPVLRFYGWSGPAATFGYFQKIAEVERATPLRPLIRRPTGGGIVPHDRDWTYSFTAPPAHEWYELKAEQSYRRIHEWLRDAFTIMKIETDLAPASKKTLPGQCFAGYEKFDLLWHGKKIAGAAQRRNKLGLLIQGSVQPPPFSPVREHWEDAMRKVAKDLFAVDWEDFSPNVNFLSQTGELARQKFSQDEYNRRR